MKAVPSLLLCVLCVLSHTLWFAQSADICVDPLNGNDGLCTAANSCTAQACRTLTKSVSLAAQGDTVKATDHGAFSETVQIVAKALHFQAHPLGNLLNGTLHWSGDCTGVSSVNGFIIHFNGVDSAISFSGAKYTQADLNITVQIDSDPVNGTIGVIDIIDFESTDKLGTTPNNWQITFMSTLTTPISQQINLFNVQTPQKMQPDQNDLSLTAYLNGPFVPSGQFSGYNAALTFKSVNQVIPAGQTKTFLTVENCNGLGLILEAAWPVEVIMNNVNISDVSFAADIDSLLIANSRNITLLNKQHITFKTLHLENVRAFKAQDIDNTPIVFFNNFTSGDVTLDVLFEDLVNCTITVDQGSGTATPTNFNVKVQQSSFDGATTRTVINNPYNEAPIDARNNYFGPGGPYTTCNEKGQGPTVSNNVYYGYWCTNLGCTTYANSTCGLPPPPSPPTPTPTPTPTVPEHHPGLSAGGIVGIVFGVLAVVILAGVAVWYIKFRKSDYSAI